MKLILTDMRKRCGIIHAILFLFPLGLFASSSVSNKLNVTDEAFKKAVSELKVSLKKEHADQRMYFPKHVSWIPDAPKLAFQPSAVRLKLMNHIMPAPRQDILTSFSSPTSIKRIQTFMTEHEAVLKQAEQKYGVPATYIVGILYIETAFNAPYVKYYPAIDTLVSLALLHYPEFRAHIISQVRAQASQYAPDNKWLSEKAWEDRAADIGQQWFQQLKDFLNLAVVMKWEKSRFREIESSWAGAIGFSQFMPSTAIKHLEKETFDLWSWSDSIHFTAQELSKNSFDAKSPKKALYAYNRVSWYGEAVLAIVEGAQKWWNEKRTSSEDVALARSSGVE